MMKNYKVVMIFVLGTILALVVIMFIYRGGPPGLKTNQLRAEFNTIIKAMKMNYAAKGYYINSIGELQEYGDVDASFYSFFLTPDEYLLCDGVKVDQIPEEYRNMAFSDYSTFLVIAVQCVYEGEKPAVFTLDENNTVMKVAGE